ncbi:phosphoribosylformylglycinamidine synthase subunit PurQ [Tunicatimonas pelagia]|uniref:phosphoribosylformylglycinamidine synthase subunit PurQ n=1 Tax=Tunicatimonas pelagia TaxID=931531 RepID=UPI00266592E3|nr:phosphoribosylformylglycinamidine synthase subunit PurQ [Tunicatimonas pelagia]WKN42712.1 phosphoribosylformylglycinamidine synthase subunit PurQ [Tunicatimonas pelagia]
MKIGIIVFPGSNCDEDIYYVFKHILQQNTVKLWHKSANTENCDLLVVPGGFSYGDYLRAGAIARFSPIMDSVIKHANQGGYVLGICNGFQILTEARLLPGVLLPNVNQQFICKNIYLKAASDTNIMTASLDPNKAYKVPIAHAEGRFYASEDELKAMQDQEQIMFYYVNESGEVDETSNCNGSINSIAGVTNQNKNVMGLMPHPERAADEALHNTDGRELLASVLKLEESLP